jgi:ATP-dependent Clp protease protease subunit
MATRTAKQTKKNLEEDIVEAKSPGIYLLFTDIGPEVAQDVCSWILSENLSENPPDVLTLMVCSPGGELAPAFAIIEMMRGSRIPVRTVALGEVCSAGLIISMSGTKGLRVITPTCSIMSHHFSGGASGDYHTLMNIEKEYKFTDKRMLDHYKRCTGLTESKVRKELIPNKDVYLSPTEAVKLGLFDEIKGIGLN